MQEELSGGSVGQKELLTVWAHTDAGFDSKHQNSFPLTDATQPAECRQKFVFLLHFSLVANSHGAIFTEYGFILSIGLFSRPNLI